MEYPQEFLELLQPGKTLRLFYNVKNVNNKLMHVRAIVDDSQVVYRVWSHRKGWMYRVESRYSLHWQWAHGVLTMASSRQRKLAGSQPIAAESEDVRQPAAADA